MRRGRRKTERTARCFDRQGLRPAPAGRRLLAAAALVLAAQGLGAAGGAAEFTSRDGSSVTGEIVFASGNSIMVRDPTGAMVQLGRGALERVEVATEAGPVVGSLESWSDGVYEIRTENFVVTVQGRKVLTERRIFPKIIVGASQGNEDGEGLVFDVSLSKPVDIEILLLYSTVDGTAQAGSDYEPLQGSLLLKPGDTRAEVRIPVVDDQLAESDESFELLVTSDMDLEEFKILRAVGTIYDNE